MRREEVGHILEGNGNNFACSPATTSASERVSPTASVPGSIRVDRHFGELNQHLLKG
jgi:hypothetical protein